MDAKKEGQIMAWVGRTLMLGCSGLLAMGVASPRGYAQDTHPFNAQDLWEMDRISDPQVSPDGGWVVFGLSSLDQEANRRRSDLWVVGVDGSELRRLTTHPAAEFNPRWAPDGSSLFFLSTRSGSSQVWRIAMDGGEAQQVTDLPLDVGSMALSPDGSHLAVSMEVFTDCPELACTVDRLADAEAKVSSGVLYDRLFIRHWDTWEDGRRSHIFVLPVSGEGSPWTSWREWMPTLPPFPSEAPRSSPSPPMAPESSSPPGWRERPSHGPPTSISSSPPSTAPRAPQLLTTENRAWDTQPVFSPDGRTLAYLAMERPGFEADRFRIVLRDWPGGELGSSPRTGTDPSAP